MYCGHNERLHAERYNTFRIVILCVDYCYYYILLLAQARPKMPCIYTSWGERERAPHQSVQLQFFMILYIYIYIICRTSCRISLTLYFNAVAAGRMRT